MHFFKIPNISYGNTDNITAIQAFANHRVHCAIYRFWKIHNIYFTDVVKARNIIKKKAKHFFIYTFTSDFKWSNQF